MKKREGYTQEIPSAAPLPPDASAPRMVLTAAILLAAYAISIVVVLLMPPKQPDPQRGQAVGCLMIVVIALLALGGVLALAAAYDVRWLIRTIFALTVYPAVMIVASMIVQYRKTGRWTK